MLVALDVMSVLFLNASYFLRTHLGNILVCMLWKMLLAVALLLLFVHQAYSQFDYGHLNIDCGEDGVYADVDDDNITWNSDYFYINELCGYNHKINKSINYKPMNTLRIFPDMNKNCYTLPAFIQQKYLLRAGFFYGNYDGLSKPPTFHLQFDASEWATVVSSEDQPVFFEAVVMAKKHNISVCVARTREGGTPFMSSLEMMQLLPGMYGSIGNDHALFKQYRVSFGSNQTIRYPDDKYGRIWEPAPPTGYSNLTANFQSLVSTVQDDPPLLAIKIAIQAPSPSDPIILLFSVQDPVRPSYVALYFAELAKLKPNQNRTFDVYFNGEDYNLKMSPIYQICNEIQGYTDPTAGPFNVTLAPSKNSNLPPVISAMELYTVSETLANGTALEDILGLRRVAHSSRLILARWSGDPCLPIAWEWLRCNQEDPPRITALYLANLDLQFLSDFSDMQALEIIDLQNNSLLGHIPDFLGDFPNLKELNLASNKLWGLVPQSLLNSRLSLNISGNPDLILPISKQKKSHIGLIVGLWVAAIVLVICFFVVVFIIRRTRGEKRVGTVEVGMVPGEIHAAGPLTGETQVAGPLSDNESSEENEIATAEEEGGGVGAEDEVASTVEERGATEDEVAVAVEGRGGGAA